MTPEETRPQQAQGVRPPAATQAKASKSDKDDPIEMAKKRMAEAVKNNQTMVEETAADEDDEAPEPEDVTEYPEGDPDLGAIDPENPDRPIAHMHRRAYLIRQAERNQAANDQLNAMQVAQNRRVRDIPGILTDPDYLRETSMETAMTAIRAHDPDVVRANHEELAKRQKARAEKDEKKNGTTK